VSSHTTQSPHVDQCAIHRPRKELILEPIDPAVDIAAGNSRAGNRQIDIGTLPEVIVEACEKGEVRTMNVLYDRVRFRFIVDVTALALRLVHRASPLAKGAPYNRLGSDGVIDPKHPKNRYAPCLVGRALSPANIRVCHDPNL